VFAVIEALVRRIVKRSADLDHAVVELRRVTRIDDSAIAILADLVTTFTRAGKSLLVVDGGAHARDLRRLEERLAAPESQGRALVFPNLDSALEWCENRLLARGEADLRPTGSLRLAEHRVCRGLDPKMIVRLESLLVRQRFAPGELITRRGEPADRLYLLVRGEVSVVVELANGVPVRLSTLSPGMAFGELAVVERGVRSADVRADGDVECWALSVDAFDALGETDPRLKMKLLENLLANVSQMLVHANREIAALTE